MTARANRAAALRCNLRGWCALMLMVLMCTGCATTRKQAARYIRTESRAPAAATPVDAAYRLACPDIVEIRVASMPEASGQYVVSAEGRIALESLDCPRVEGETTASLTRRISDGLFVPLQHVSCRVTEARSRIVFVRGPIMGGDRAIAYEGPETVVNLIRRCGGLTPNADVRDVHLIRGNVAQGVKPQVFEVDLQAILMEGDQRTNMMLQPCDEIWIGELRRAKIGKALPPWMRPLVRGFCQSFPDLCPHDWREQIRDGER